MFIYSLHANTIKFFAVICLALTVLITLIAFVPSYTDGEDVQSVGAPVSYNYEKVKSNADRINFLKQFGWEVNPEPINEQTVLIPKEFDKILAEYNEIQRKQGLDLSTYKKKNVVRYTYLLTNYPDYEGEVYVNLLIYRNTVIGGDICSADINGFVHGFEKKQKKQCVCIAFSILYFYLSFIVCKISLSALLEATFRMYSLSL